MDRIRNSRGQFVVSALKFFPPEDPRSHSSFRICASPFFQTPVSRPRAHNRRLISIFSPASAIRSDGTPSASSSHNSTSAIPIFDKTSCELSSQNPGRREEREKMMCRNVRDGILSVEGRLRGVRLGVDDLNRVQPQIDLRRDVDVVTATIIVFDRCWCSGVIPPARNAPEILRINQTQLRKTVVKRRRRGARLGKNGRILIALSNCNS
jgi:hypothetical protein